MDQDTLLSISHLHKQFADIKQNAPSIGSSQSANELHEQKIYNILPLFSLNDLTRKDDLILLFNVITSWCPEHNSMWRKTAADTIITMAKHGNLNVDYLHSKNCIHLFVENVQRILELGTAPNNEIILMIRTFILFMLEYVNHYQNSGNTNNSNLAIQILLDDFNECFGYQCFVDFGIKLEQSEDFNLLAEFIDLIGCFTKIGIEQLKPRPLSVNQVFIIENFSIPKPTLKKFDKKS
ncbi:WD repeat and FYVE domain-containing protein 3 [Dermatophagoides pteronyssinus]|uniref:WD repeat and FYVE domain-containing protein 3 n=1 Tax=Dermatophagoides pteronyssinus TaxID=6956 RepID=A0ABQ8ITP5_DERPT|nr:WD repeat and FYVE domain-containing protein 3 [Dermatophagoides pteronyssinus]